ncbi:uncharacterized protein LOC113240265 [Hyposmocoma kahamanoa]|uniref:uncharacterized protein LOC113240265 n=1 Tax=Hyposmocoma kahamanoa TaxID=1477025 RepID=UPI000E6D698B|nr:uncharacterized protein LOC113240265 [Hyposmocoma kahamanoa]
MEKSTVLILFTLALVPVAKSAIPGTFFWKPRMAIDLSIPTGRHSGSLLRSGSYPTKENIRDGQVVLIDGYEMGLTAICFAEGVSTAMVFAHLNPLKSNFYTDVYRWLLRYINIIPEWLNGEENIVDTTKLWRRRFYNVDSLTPKILRPLLFYIPKSQWDAEDKEMVLFNKYAKGAFSKHLRLPSKKFNNFASFETIETSESEESSNYS